MADCIFWSDRNLVGRRPHLRDSSDRHQGAIPALRYVHCRRPTCRRRDFRRRRRRGFRAEERHPGVERSLKITWAATSPKGVGSRIVQVDGESVTAMDGPYGGEFYSCSIGKQAVGNHSYKITVTDETGVSFHQQRHVCGGGPCPAGDQQCGRGRGGNDEERHPGVERR